MKITNPIRFFLNILIYTLIVFCLYYLYSPLNEHPNNKTGSSVQFVYQQF